MKLIDLYYEWMETGELPKDGLCHSIPDEYYELLEEFEPNSKDYNLLLKKEMASAHWGSGLKMYDVNRFRKFTELRQTIVLLICAMKNEL